MNAQRIRVKLKSFDVELIDQSAQSIAVNVKKTGARVSGPIPLPTSIRRVTVLRSPHVNIKSREQFEMRIHKRLIDIFNVTPQTMDSLKRLELPAGVDVEVKQ
ncbi:MAG: 30S ribosomal protein S10 [Spirochaetes bacterium]|nr:30S ribosomal protein S10 [Spirochaetota bacterium]